MINRYVHSEVIHCPMILECKSEKEFDKAEGQKQIVNHLMFHAKHKFSSAKAKEVAEINGFTAYTTSSPRPPKKNW